MSKLSYEKAVFKCAWEELREKIEKLKEGEDQSKIQQELIELVEDRCKYMFRERLRLEKKLEHWNRVLKELKE